MGSSRESSDSQAMGSAARFVNRTWRRRQDEEQRGRLKEEAGDNDKVQVKRYVATYTTPRHHTASRASRLDEVASARLVIFAGLLAPSPTA